MNTTNPKISIIIPVYNVEAYLRQCLQSVAVQTMQDIEVLIINNNSPDNSAAIIEEFVAKYPHFYTYLCVGGGAGGARNEGLKHAKGDYIIFIDSDDWVAPDMCKKLYDAAVSNNADMVGCGFYFASHEGQILRADKSAIDSPFIIDSAKDGMLKMLQIGGNLGGPCIKIIKRDIIIKNNLQFPEDVTSEDVAFISTCFILSNKYVQISDPLWFYRYLPTSASNTRRDLAPKNLFKNFALMRAFLEQKGLYGQLQEEWEFRLVSMLIGGEGAGNGSIKNLPEAKMFEFFALCRSFYLNLPADLFKDRSPVFKFKFWLFKTALQYNWYFLPHLMRGPVNIFAALYKPCINKNK